MPLLKKNESPIASSGARNSLVANRRQHTIDKDQPPADDVNNSKGLVNRQIFPIDEENDYVVSQQKENLQKASTDKQYKDLVDRVETVKNVSNDKSKVVVKQQQEISKAYPAGNRHIISQQKNKPPLIRQEHEVFQKPPHEVSQGLQTSSKNILVDELKRRFEQLQDNKVTDAAGELADRLDDDPAKETVKVIEDEAAVDRLKSTVELDRQHFSKNILVEHLQNNKVTDAAVEVAGTLDQCYVDPTKETINKVIADEAAVDRLKSTVELDRQHFSKNILVEHLQNNKVTDAAVEVASTLDQCYVDPTKETINKVIADEAVVDPLKSTVELKQHPWRVVLHIKSVDNKGVLRGIPHEIQLFQWNTTVVFGRGEDVNIFLNDETASRKHLGLTGFLLQNRQACFSVTNLSNTNGVLVNDTELLPKLPKPIMMNTGDRINIVTITFELEIIPGADTECFVLEFVVPNDWNQYMEGGANKANNTPLDHNSVYVAPMTPQRQVSIGLPDNEPLGQHTQGMVPLGRTPSANTAIPSGMHSNIMPLSAPVAVPEEEAPLKANLETKPNTSEPVVPADMSHKLTSNIVPAKVSRVVERTRTSTKAGQIIIPKKPKVPRKPKILREPNTSAAPTGVPGMVTLRMRTNQVAMPGNLNYTHDTIKLCNNLRFLAGEVVSKWKAFGRALSLEEHNLTNIHLDNPEHYEKSYQMLLTWFYKNASNSAAKNSELLHKALCDSTVGRDDLAVKYCPQNREDKPHGNDGDEDDGDNSDSNGDA